MWILLLVFGVTCASRFPTIFDGTCLRLDPPPGVLIVSPGSDLVLTCSGHVTVDGVKVRNSSNTERVVGASQTTVNSTTTTGVLMNNETDAVENATSQTSQNRSLRHRDAGYTASPTAQMGRSTSVHGLLNSEEMGKERDYHEEEEGSMVTRGTDLMPLWKWTRRRVKKRDQGTTTCKRGDTLSLSSVGPADSGTYSCHHRGRKRFSLKVIIADPPEKPSLSCYKRSPSSVIVCEWIPQKPVTVKPNCYLLLLKRPSKEFLPSPCSYSDQTSRCRCALHHGEYEHRTVHSMFLCVTSMVGNDTSALLHVSPLNILKPDPPSNLSVQQVEGHKRTLMVTWSLPDSWKYQDYFYDLIYELLYRPLESIHNQSLTTRVQHFSIRDAMPGVEYLIQLRIREEYDGQWSDWSTPVYATSWTAPMSATTMIPLYEDDEFYGTDGNPTDVAPRFPAFTPHPAEIPTHIFWILGSFALFSVILAAFIFRHKDWLMTKLQSLRVITQGGSSPLPPSSATTAPEGLALVTFGQPSKEKHPPCEVVERGEENEE